MNQQQSMQSIAAANAANVEAMRSLAFASLKATERLLNLNLGFARNSLRFGADYRPAPASDWQGLVAQQTNSLQKTGEEAAEYLRGVYDISAEAQADLGELISSRMDELGDSMTSIFEAMAKNAPAGSENAVNMLKSAVADTCAAYSRIIKTTAQQAAAVAVEPAPKRGRRAA